MVVHLKQIYYNHLKCLLILIYFLVLFILISIYFVGSASSYEMSIYDEYESCFWIIIIIIIVINQLSFIYSYLNKQKPKYFLFCNVISMALINLILLNLPSIRGYYIYGSGDVLTHIGYIRDILSTGNIINNMYPSVHILAGSTSIISNIPVHFFTRLFPPFFSILFILFFIVLMKTITNNTGYVIVSLAFSMLLLFGNANMSLFPNNEAFLLSPLILYMLFNRAYKNDNVAFSLIIIISIFALTFYHPLVSFMLGILLLIMDATYYIFSEKISILHKINSRNSHKLIAILFIVYISWQSYAFLIFNKLKLIYQWLFHEGVKSDFVSYTDTLSEVNLSPLYFMELIFKIQGINLILIVLALFGIFHSIYSYRSQNRKLEYYQLFSMLAFFFTLFLSGFCFFVGIGFGFGRIMDWTRLFALIIIPFSISPILRRLAKLNKHKVCTILLIIILVNLSYLSVFCLYLSPFVKFSGQHVPYSFIVGSEFLFGKRNSEIPVLEYGIVAIRFHDALYGTNSSKKNLILSDKILIPDHFGYNNSCCFGQAFDGERYFILSDMGKQIYPKIFPEFPDNWRFTKRDFDHLDEDNSVSHIYNNSGIDLYLTRP